MHAHLLDDLKVADLVDSVEIYLNFKSFIDSQITPHWQQATTRAPEELRQGVYQSFSIAEWFLENRDSFINSANNWVNPLLQSQSYLEDPEVKYIEDPDVITIENVVMVEEHKAYLDATALADVVIDVFIHKSEYYSSPEMPNLDIMDSDWNEYYVWGQLSLKLPIAFSVILNIINEQVEQFEINPLREIYGWCKHCGQPVLSDAAENCSNCRRSLLPGRIISINF